MKLIQLHKEIKKGLFLHKILVKLSKICILIMVVNSNRFVKLKKR